MTARLNLAEIDTKVEAFNLVDHLTLAAPFDDRQLGRLADLVSDLAKAGSRFAKAAEALAEALTARPD